jgi:hypothetical protein
LGVGHYIISDPQRKRKKKEKEKKKKKAATKSARPVCRFRSDNAPDTYIHPQRPMATGSGTKDRFIKLVAVKLKLLWANGIGDVRLTGSTEAVLIVFGLVRMDQDLVTRDNDVLS